MCLISVSARYHCVHCGRFVDFFNRFPPPPPNNSRFIQLKYTLSVLTCCVPKHGGAIVVIDIRVRFNMRGKLFMSKMGPAQRTNTSHSFLSTSFVDVRFSLQQIRLLFISWQILTRKNVLVGKFVSRTVLNTYY